jgi:hypothetical protein
MRVEFVECGVCGSGQLGDLFPSGTKREDGTTPHDNFVCLLCQREACIRCEVDWWLDWYERGRIFVAVGAPSPELFAADICSAV